MIIKFSGKTREENNIRLSLRQSFSESQPLEIFSQVYGLDERLSSYGTLTTGGTRANVDWYAN